MDLAGLDIALSIATISAPLAGTVHVNRFGVLGVDEKLFAPLEQTLAPSRTLADRRTAGLLYF